MDPSQTVENMKFWIISQGIALVQWILPIKLDNIQSEVLKWMME